MLCKKFLNSNKKGKCGEKLSQTLQDTALKKICRNKYTKRYSYLFLIRKLKAKNLRSTISPLK